MPRVTCCRRRGPAWLVATLVACTGPVERNGVDAEPTSHERSEETLSREQLLDPVACQACHPAQYEEWSGSMHAYASRDPVFLAMNARGQEETGGKLGDFCVQCHAPMAAREGLTADGLNIADLPDAYQGVTCYFCHNAEAVEGDHNNPVRLANDTVMRGPFRDPVATTGHPSSYSTHFDKDHADSAALCGACHDVLVHDAFAPANVALERTYLEWQASLFNAPTASGGLTCNGCHMPISPRRDQAASGEDMPQRASRRHDFEGVDVALDDFPGKTRQRLLVQQFLDSSLLAEICVSRDGVVAIAIENASAGHHWPSGASHDRLAWLDVRAYNDTRLIYRTAEPESDIEAKLWQDSDNDSGTGPTQMDGGADDTSGVGDWVVGKAITLTDTVVDQNGEPAHFFWQVARVDSSTTLPAVITRDPLAPGFHQERRTWELNTEQSGFDTIQRVELTVKLRPIKLEILAELVRTGHLERKIARVMPTFAVLPERCHEQTEIDRFADILLGARDDCDATDQAHAVTLLWDRSKATSDNRYFRQTVIQSSPALCLSHPTYIPPP